MRRTRSVYSRDDDQGSTLNELFKNGQPSTGIADNGKCKGSPYGRLVDGIVERYFPDVDTKNADTRTLEDKNLSNRGENLASTS